MSRLANFNALTEHAWFRKVHAKLSKNDIEIAIQFIVDNHHLGHNEFESAVNRMFLDKPKPKNWTIIQELLANSNAEE